MLKIGYISFSENRINKKTVHQYLVHLILNNKEPRVHDIYLTLTAQQVRYHGYFSDLELTEALEKISPLYSEQLRQRLFSATESFYSQKKGYITTMKASQITAYLILLQQRIQLMDDISERHQGEFVSSTSSVHNELIGYSNLVST